MDGQPQQMPPWMRQQRIQQQGYPQQPKQYSQQQPYQGPMGPQQQPMQQRPMQPMQPQQPPMMPPGMVPPSIVPEKRTPPSAKKKRLFYVFLVLTIITGLMAVASGIYFYLNYMK